MYIIINPQRNANQDHNEISPHTCLNDYYPKKKKKKKKNNKRWVLGKMWIKENPCALLVGIKSCSYYRKQYKVSSKKNTIWY